MDRVSKNPGNTRHPTILKRPEPKPDFDSETQSRPNPTMKTRQNPKGFIKIKNRNFGQKKPTFWQKLYQFYLDINEQKYFNFFY